MLKWNTLLTGLCLLSSISSFAEERNLTLNEVQELFHGPDYLHPSADSLVGKYLAETGAATLIQPFWTAPENSIFPPRERGPKRLVVSVSPKTFPVFMKYFSSKHFLYLLNEHGTFAAFEGKMSNPNEVGWQAHVLDTDLAFLDQSNLSQSRYVTNLPRIAAPMILDSNEGDRAHDYFELARRAPKVARKPWELKNAGGKRYSTRGGWADGCGTWIGNMPIGNELVDEYFFASGDADGTQPAHAKLIPFDVPAGLDAETTALLKKVWTVPGHKQLSEILDPQANRRGEFDNSGWTTYKFVGTATPERVPVIFYFVENAHKRIKPDFEFAMDRYGAM